MPHLPPASHPAFFCSSRLTLNITRRSMANYGYCPSGRLFEAAACGSTIVSDWWEGLDSFFAPGSEILRVQTTSDVLDAISLSDQELSRIAETARQRALSEHTADKRALELESMCQDAINRATNQVSVA
jgi:spore maturation protein CgeB